MHEELDSGHSRERFAPVVFAHDMDEADFYQSLLEDHGIDVHLDEDFRNSRTELDDTEDDGRGIAVLVDSEHFIEAEVVIQHRLDEEDIDDDGEGGDDDYDGDDENEFEGLEEFDPDNEG